MKFLSKTQLTKLTPNASKSEGKRYQDLSRPREAIQKLVKNSLERNSQQLLIKYTRWLNIIKKWESSYNIHRQYEVKLSRLCIWYTRFTYRNLMSINVQQILCRIQKPGSVQNGRISKERMASSVIQRSYWERIVKWGNS